MWLLDFVSSGCHNILYLSISLWHSLFHHNFECFVIFTIFKYLNQISSVSSVNSYTIFSRFSLFEMCSILSPLMDSISLARKFFSSSLFFMIICFLVWICSLIIVVLIVSRVWSDGNLHSGKIIWLSNSDKVYWRNMRSMTKFKSFWLSEYLVGTWLVGLDIYKLIESTMSVRRSWWIEWWGKEGS